MTEMNTVLDNIDKWLSELESGKHKQGKEWLRKGDSYCCLGVACEFVLGIEPKPRDARYFPEDTYDYNYAASYLPDDTSGSIGLHYADGSGYLGTESLTQLNDLLEKSFPEIAAILREDLSTNKYGYFIEAVYPAWAERHSQGVAAV